MRGTGVKAGCGVSEGSFQGAPDPICHPFAKASGGGVHRRRAGRGCRGGGPMDVEIDEGIVDGIEGIRQTSEEGDQRAVTTGNMASNR